MLHTKKLEERKQNKNPTTPPGETARSQQGEVRWPDRPDESRSSMGTARLPGGSRRHVLLGKMLASPQPALPVTLGSSALTPGNSWGIIRTQCPSLGGNPTHTSVLICVILLEGGPAATHTSVPTVNPHSHHEGHHVGAQECQENFIHSSDLFYPLPELEAPNLHIPGHLT